MCDAACIAVVCGMCGVGWVHTAWQHRQCVHCLFWFSSMRCSYGFALHPNSGLLHSHKHPCSTVTHPFALCSCTMHRVQYYAGLFMPGSAFGTHS